MAHAKGGQLLLRKQSVKSPWVDLEIGRKLFQREDFIIKARAGHAFSNVTGGTLPHKKVDYGCPMLAAVVTFSLAAQSM